MSYCVNCGVELDKTCSVCPLCNTKVYNPNQEIDHISPTPFPTRKGYASPVQKSDITLLISIVLAVTAAVCGLLNIFVFQGSSWSMYVIGGCVLLWIFCLPVFFYRMNAYLSILLDGAGIAMYFGIISWLHPGNGWYRLLALPAIAAGLLGTAAAAWAATALDVGLLRKFFGAYLLYIGVRELLRKKEG